MEQTKEEKLADTMKIWYGNTKARQADYTQQLLDLEAANDVAEYVMADDSLHGSEYELNAPVVSNSCHKHTVTSASRNLAYLLSHPPVLNNSTPCLTPPSPLLGPHYPPRLLAHSLQATT